LPRNLFLGVCFVFSALLLKNETWLNVNNESDHSHGQQKRLASAPENLQQFKEYTMNKTLVMVVAGAAVVRSLRRIRRTNYLINTEKIPFFVTMGDFLKRYSSNHDWIVSECRPGMRRVCERI
tara:strand:+ start:105 stop:473 length:369 start_codon:yes stop_codon:yes gene_type:complete